MSHKVKVTYVEHGLPPVYWECPECGLLSSDAAFGNPATPCPLCGNLPTSRREYPTERLRRLDARIREYHDEGEYEIVVILVAAFLEAILEDIIDRVLTARGATLDLRKLLLDSQRSIGQRVGHLFPELTGTEFEEAAAKHGFADFPQRWRDMRAARNAFIHDSPFHGAQETLDKAMGEQAMGLLSQAYGLFVQLNNEFVAHDGDRRQ